MTVQALVIADGTPDRTVVWDVRGLEQWAAPTGGPHPHSDPHPIIIHHTVTDPAGTHTRPGQLAHLRRIRDTAPYGLPYNFVLFPTGRPWYVNDVDRCWPHTWGYNAATAIACAGNYELLRPGPAMLRRLATLVRALAHMWRPQHRCVVLAHRDVAATACPGRYLAPVVPVLLQP